MNENLKHYEQAQQTLDALVSDIHAHHPIMRYRSICDVLTPQFGLRVSDSTVCKSIRRLQIYGYTQRRNVPSYGNSMEHTSYPNWLHRNFHADIPTEDDHQRNLSQVTRKLVLSYRLS